MLKNVVLVAGLLFTGACWSSDQGAPQVAKVPPSAAKVAVTMTAATLADDCGGTAPTSPPAVIHHNKGAAKADMDEPKSKAKSAKRRCEQTSMQLSVIAPAGAPATTIKVKKVELYDADSGKLIGTALTASSPTVWVDANGRYEAWNQSVAADAKLSVSYVLSQPDWSGVKDKTSRSYVLKAVVTIGGADQTVSHEAEVAAPTILPPNVKT